MSSAAGPAPIPRLRERLRHDAEQGAWHDGPRRYLLLRPDSLMGALRGLDAASRDVVFDALAQSLQHHGGDSLRAYSMRVNGDAQALIAATVDAAGDLGWGVWEIEHRDGALELVVRNSPFAAGWLAAQGDLAVAPVAERDAGKRAHAETRRRGEESESTDSSDLFLRDLRACACDHDSAVALDAAPQSAPTVCAPIRGMFCALLQTLGDPTARVHEIACAVQGHAACRFRAAPARARGAA